MNKARVLAARKLHATRRIIRSERRAGREDEAARKVVDHDGIRNKIDATRQVPLDVGSIEHLAELRCIRRGRGAITGRETDVDGDASQNKQHEEQRDAVQGLISQLAQRVLAAPRHKIRLPPQLTRVRLILATAHAAAP